MKTQREIETRAKELLTYDPDSGIFRWSVRTSNRIKAGDDAGSMNLAGYMCIRILGGRVYAHRLAWWWMTGEWAEQVDHRDGMRSNNAFLNLRQATNQQNSQNRRASGVTTSKRKKNPFRAQITHGGHTIALGHFHTEIAAHNAYVSAKRKLHEYGTL